MKLNHIYKTTLLVSILSTLLCAGVSSFAAEENLPKPIISNKCTALFNNKKTELVSQKGFQISEITQGQRAIYEHVETGFHLTFELAPSKNWRTEVDLVNFTLDYDPTQLLPGSFFRRVLGNVPMKYSAEDLRNFTTQTIYLSKGRVLEFFLRLPYDTHKDINHGPLISVALETGAIIGYPAGTDVDASVGSLLNRTANGMLGFANGLSIELQNSMRKQHGQWFLESKNNNDLKVIEGPSHKVLESDSK